MMISIKEALFNIRVQLASSPHSTNSALDAEVMLGNILNVEREFFISNRDDLIDPNIYQDALNRRLSGEPIAYITGKKEFWGRDFIVTPDTLIPRPETELIVELVLESKLAKKNGLNILDLGTGSGCLFVTLMKEIPNAKGLAVDLSEAALDVAQQNAKKNGLNISHFIQSDWFKSVPPQKFDLIVSNPPYIDLSEDLPVSVKNYEPKSALFADNKGLGAYENIARDLKNYLAVGGSAYFEFGLGQAELVSEIFRKNGFNDSSIHKDLAGIDRVIHVKN